MVKGIVESLVLVKTKFGCVCAIVVVTVIDGVCVILGNNKCDIINGV